MSPRGGMTKPEKPENTAMGAWHPLLAWLCLTCCGRTWAVPSVACPDVQQGTLQVNLGQLGVKSVCCFMFFFPKDVSSQGSSKDCWRISIIPHISIQHVSCQYISFQYVSLQYVSIPYVSIQYVFIDYVSIQKVCISRNGYVYECRTYTFVSKYVNAKHILA